MKQQNEDTSRTTINLTYVRATSQLVQCCGGAVAFLIVAGRHGGTARSLLAGARASPSRRSPLGSLLSRQVQRHPDPGDAGDCARRSSNARRNGTGGLGPRLSARCSVSSAPWVLACHYRCGARGKAAMACCAQRLSSRPRERCRLAQTTVSFAPRHFETREPAATSRPCPRA